MNNSEETLQNEPVLQAIAELSKKIDGLNNRFDTFEKTVDIQFEVIREGIAYNSAKFDRMEAKIFDARSDISNFRADIKELTEQIRQKTKETLIFEK